SWNQCIATLQGAQRIGDDKNMMRNMIANFAREFDMTVSQQRDYCIADLKLRAVVCDHVKRAILTLYSPLMQRVEMLGEQFVTRQLKYTTESLESNIDRLFDASS
ncbi:Exocyst complex component 7, partial [Trichostrongylus colubriformis]